MSKNNKEKWVNNVFDSMKGSRRARPSTDLFGKIEHQLDSSEPKVIPMNQFRMIAAAAVLLLVLNVYSLREVVQGNLANNGELVVENAPDQQLISNYKIYEK